MLASMAPEELRFMLLHKAVSKGVEIPDVGDIAW